MTTASIHLVFHIRGSVMELPIVRMEVMRETAKVKLPF